MTDDELYDLVRLGIKPAFDMLYNKYRQSVFMYVYRIHHDTQFCDDVVQEVFIWIWENRLIVPINVNIQSYLIGIAYNKHIDRVRKDRLHMKYLCNSIISMPRAAYQNKDSRDKLINDEFVKAFGEIRSQLKKDIFLMNYYHNIKPKQISLMLGISCQNVKNKLTEVRGELRYKLRHLVK